MPVILEAHELTMQFDQDLVFKNVNFKLERGSKTALLGENGSGKTTLIRIIIGMLYPTSGWVHVEDVDGHLAKIGYVPQFRNIDRDYPLSIESFVSLNAPTFRTKEYDQRLADVLEKTNLTKIKDERLGRASGGQKQRAYLAQALIDNPDLVILDESTASLDPVAKEELLDLLDQLNVQDNLSIIFATHDIELAHQHMNDYLLLENKTMTSGKMADFKFSEVVRDV